MDSVAKNLGYGLMVVSSGLSVVLLATLLFSKLCKFAEEAHDKWAAVTFIRWLVARRILRARRHGGDPEWARKNGWERIKERIDFEKTITNCQVLEIKSHLIDSFIDYDYEDTVIVSPEKLIQDRSKEEENIYLSEGRYVRGLGEY
jgi:hypothetical protein